MNKRRRSNLVSALEHIQQAIPITESAMEEERDALANLPESLEGSERYADMERQAECLEEAVDRLGEAVSYIQEAMG